MESNRKLISTVCEHDIDWGEIITRYYDDFTCVREKKNKHGEILEKTEETWSYDDETDKK